MNLFSILIPLALVAVVAVLLLGVFSMMKGGELNQKYSNKLMRWRVILQTTAVILILLSLVLENS